MSDAPDFAVRGGLSTRIHLAVRGQAANLRFALTGGQPGDRRQRCGRGHAEQPVLPCKYPLDSISTASAASVRWLRELSAPPNGRAKPAPYQRVGPMRGA